MGLDADREAPMSSLPRMLNDRYELLEAVGQGGEANVYRALDTVLGVERAVKMPHSTKRLGDVQVARWRFMNEARLLAKFEHPYLLRIFDIHLDEPPFLVAEYCPAGSVKSLGQLEPAKAIRLMQQVAEVLAALHDQEVVHRDVKPSNILLHPDGTPRLCDLGIARHGSEQTITSTGAMMGTVLFMSPEQRISTHGVSPAADQYSLAATTYALITGMTPIDLFMANPNSPRWWELSDGVAAAIRRATQYEPSDRFPSILEFAAALESADPQPAGGRATNTAVVPPSLVSWYRQSVARRLDAVRAALKGIEREEAGAGDELRRLAHVLRGSGASYGFPSVSETAALTEDADDSSLANRGSELLYVLRDVAEYATSVPVAASPSTSSLSTATTRTDRTTASVDRIGFTQFVAVERMKSPGRVYFVEPVQLSTKVLADLEVVAYTDRSGVFAWVGVETTTAFEDLLTGLNVRFGSVDAGRNVPAGELLDWVEAYVDTPSENGLTELSRSRSSKRILLVEDDDAMAELVTRVALEAGHEVKWLRDGEEALAALDQAFDLLVLDVDLPKASGWEVLQAVRSEPQCRDASVLMLTARATDDDVVLALELGADDHLAKPFDIRVLTARMRTLLRR